MAVSLFIEFEGASQASDEASDEWLRALGGPFVDVPGVTSVELYVPAGIVDPLIDEGAPPPLVAQLRFPNAATAEEGMASPVLARALDEVTAFAGAVRPRAADVVESHLYPEAGEADASGTAVAVTYLVHYRRPADDEAHFVRYYLDNHPAIMARLPRIRRLEIYTPVAVSTAPPLPSADSMLICDVSFDSAAELDASLASDVRMLLREDFHSFPPYDGPVTHFAMRRLRLAP